MRLIILLLLFSLSLNAQINNGEDPTTRYNFKPGEHMEFKLSYGWFTVGKASFDIDGKYHQYKNSKSYKVDVTGETAGFLGAFTHVNDRWGAYISSGNLAPQHAYRDIEEGKYMREERTYFDHQKGKVEVLRYDPRKTERKPMREYEIKGQVFDLMSSFLYLRNINYKNYHKGDTISINTFYEDELYHLKMVYDGIHTLNSKVGKLDAYRFVFLVPTSEVFPDKDGIVAYISADQNHLPLRIEAEMFFGTGYCELTSYRNIKYGPDYQQ